MAKDLTKWPVVLTYQDWQKKKGVVAKVAVKTNIGEQLQTAQRLFNASPPKSMMLAEWKSKSTARGLMEGKRRAVDFHRRNVEPIRAALERAAGLASVKAEEWKRSKTIPASAARAAAEVAKEATEYADALTVDSPQIKAWLQEYDVTAALFIEAQGLKKQPIKDALRSLYDEAVALTKEPTKWGWTEGGTSVLQSYRVVLAAINDNPNLKAKYVKEWTALQPDVLLAGCPVGTPEERAFIMSKLQIIMTSHRRFQDKWEAVYDS